MKIIRNLIASTTAQHMVFACGCLIMLSGGWGAKVALDQISAMHDSFESDMKLPSLQFRHDLTPPHKSSAASQEVKAAGAKEATKQPVLP